ncbi:MAG: hypothetical protein K0S76_1640 [Herbinix sp.]|jgi:hypothetical protein|nr:hypothetical protein [Herbinix sp.]
MDFAAFLMPVISLLTAQITTLELARFRFPPKKLFIILSLEMLIQTALNAPILIFTGLEQYALWYILVMDVPAAITFFYISERRDLRDIFTILVTIYVSFIISIPSKWISQQKGDSYLWYNLSRIIIFAFMYLIIHFFIRKRYLQLQDEIEKGWGIFSILPFIGGLLLYFEYMQYSKNGNFSMVFMRCLITIIIMMTVFVVFSYVFDQLHEKYLVLEQKRILDMQNKAQRDQFEHHKEASEITNRRWHDMRHNILEIIELLENGKAEIAISYLKEQLGVGEIHKEMYCLHPAVNSILCLWSERARNTGIDVVIRTNVPENLAIEPMEISALFANAFENAYEGCQRIPEGIQKFIKVDARYNGKQFAISVMNSCLENIEFEGDLPVSSKKGGGIGTRSMAYTVQRFHGTKYFVAKDGVFTARFLLNL